MPSLSWWLVVSVLVFSVRAQDGGCQAPVHEEQRVDESDHSHDAHPEEEGCAAPMPDDYDDEARRTYDDEAVPAHDDDDSWEAFERARGRELYLRSLAKQLVIVATALAIAWQIASWMRKSPGAQATAATSLAAPATKDAVTAANDSTSAMATAESSAAKPSEAKRKKSRKAVD